MYKAGANVIDGMNSFFTPDKKCSVALDKDCFDEQEYTAESFFEHVKYYFDRPELFYKRFDAPDETNVKEIVRKKQDGFKIFSFPSPIQTPWCENNTAYYRMFTKGGSDTILLFVPGWARPNLKIEENLCKQLLKNNIDSCLVTKPFHQERKVTDTYSGELFISGNIFLTVMNFRQQVAELRFLIHRFRQQYKNIGIIGISSGGFQGALAANVEEVDFYFPIITGARLGSMTWNGTMTKFVRHDIMRKGLSEDQLNKAWAIADQYYLGKNCRAKYIKQFLSLYDEIVPTKFQFILWEIYNKPDLFTMNCGHIGIFFYFHRIVQEIAEFVYERTNSCSSNKC